MHRFGHLEGLRGLLALYVAIGHLFPLADSAIFQGWGSRSPFAIRLLASLFAHGHLAVAAFIVVSGFCLQMALFGRSEKGEVGDLKAWYGRRAMRIAPPYYAALALSGVVCALVTVRYADRAPWSLYAPVTFEAGLSHVLLVQNLSTEWMYKVNGVLWSIAIEAQLYLLFPFLQRPLLKGGRGWAIVVAALIAGILALLVPNGTKLYFHFIPLFVAGMAGAHLAYRPGRRKPPTDRFMLAFLVLTGLALASTRWGFAALAAGDVLFGAAIAALLTALALTEGGAIRALLTRPALVNLGTMSYSLYLIHQPLEQVWYDLRPEWGSTETGGLVWGGLGLVPVVLVCAGFYWAFERPFLRRARARMHDMT